MISSFRAQCAARVVREGGVIAYPTEAVWGLGCDPWNEDAVYRLLALKARPVEKGLIVVAANIHQLDFLLEDLPDVWLDRLAGTWPGPNTWLVPHQERLPEWVTGVHDSVAVRVTDHPLVQELCHLTGPLISTSANPAGRPAARTRLRVEQYFHDELDAILGGALGWTRYAAMAGLASGLFGVALLYMTVKARVNEPLPIGVLIGLLLTALGGISLAVFLAGWGFLPF